MANRESYIAFLLEQLAPLGEVTTRPMMGGNILYCDGVVFALVARDMLYLKVDDENRPHFEDQGLKAFRPFDGPGVMQYYEAPAQLFEDPDVLMHWGRNAIGAGLRAKSKKRPRKPAKKAKAAVKSKTAAKASKTKSAKKPAPKSKRSKTAKPGKRRG